jgi:Cys-tRNA(Pro)/Cys-tRNA(Cys) deacylase
VPSLGERALKEKGVAFSSHEYDYRKKGAEAAAEALGLSLGQTLKTLVVKLDGNRFVFLLVPGDCEVSMRNLARTLHAKTAELAAERDAERLTGYQVGGIGPFGARTALPVFLERRALSPEKVYVNGGRRGLLVGLAPQALVDAASAEVVDVGITA